MQYTAPFKLIKNIYPKSKNYLYEENNFQLTNTFKLKHQFTLIEEHIHDTSTYLHQHDIHEFLLNRKTDLSLFSLKQKQQNKNEKNRSRTIQPFADSRVYKYSFTHRITMVTWHESNVIG